jgi:hypothetical protein
VQYHLVTLGVGLVFIPQLGIYLILGLIVGIKINLFKV